MSEVIKVKPWGKDQGDYVLINAEDFDESVHERLDAEKRKPGRPAGNVIGSQQPAPKDE